MKIPKKHRGPQKTSSRATCLRPLLYSHLKRAAFLCFILPGAGCITVLHFNWSGSIPVFHIGLARPNTADQITALYSVTLLQC